MCIRDSTAFVQMAQRFDDVERVAPGGLGQTPRETLVRRHPQSIERGLQRGPTQALELDQRSAALVDFALQGFLLRCRQLAAAAGEGGTQAALSALSLIHI